MTVHSFSGIGFGVETEEDLIKKINLSKNKYIEWKSVRVLIIDESELYIYFTFTFYYTFNNVICYIGFHNNK